jgi:hypothetical protein
MGVAGKGSMLSFGTFIRKGLQVEETYKAQDGSQTQTLWFHDVW